MELKEIKKINQRIYQLDTNVSRESKVIFIASLVFALTQNKDFQNPSKLTELISFNDEENKPIDQIIRLASDGVKKLNLLSKTEAAVINSLKALSGVNTNLDRDRTQFYEFVSDFISLYFPSIKPEDLFFETLYMEIDKKAKKNNEGIILTPVFAAQLMVDLAELDYKKDVVADLCSGTGLFSLLSYSQMLNDMNKALESKSISRDMCNSYQKRLYNSIIANDNEPKMVTLCLANFLLKSLNNSLLFNEDVLNLQKSSFKINDKGKKNTIQPTKAILNPPYEDTYKPLAILEKNISLVKDGDSEGKKVVAILPPQKFYKKYNIFSRILNISTLETVIKMQDDLFIDSGKSQPASIFVFNANKPHSKTDIIHYYNFSDTGYIYLKDSGMVDKNGTFVTKKKELLDKIKNSTQTFKKSAFIRSWDNFYEVSKETEADVIIDPIRIKTSRDDADIAFEKITIDRMLEEKNQLIFNAKNSYRDSDGSFEKYILSILSGD